ncbi:MAG: PTS glucose transporter subunit IIA [Clostridia bacterium]|jgi:PTS system sucrose-specific IIC component|nr:PTS glucose transporter subunit IIA [Clostridia bacterium]MBR3038508.1 PTS glucose transporter subunit IIA [Clostridia bacterium]MBR3129567.1 PTS glucose transporter subunit IIA [Clostridia bacterium]
MALDYRKCAEEIAKYIGGGSNVISAAHCATRLRLVIADNSKLDKKALEDVEGVKGMFESNGQLQLIIGTGTVNKVYDEFLAVTGVSAATKADVKAAAASKMPWWKKILKTPGDVFVPILPAIVASGLMMGIVEAIPKFWPAFGQSDWYSFLDLVANTAFALLPVLVAISAARVFGGNIFLGAVIGLMMVHPALINAWTVGSATNIPTWNIFFYPIQQVGYQGHVIPVILAVLLMSNLEKLLHKIVPEMIDLFVTPLVTVLVTAFVTFTVIGPVFSVLENYVLKGAEWLASTTVGAAVMGAIYPWTVFLGLHHMYNVIEAGMIAQTGLNTWMPIASAANFAQFGACLAVAVKVKNGKTKSVALPASLSASLGITEPAIFGVNYRFMKPFLCGMAGGAVGALFGALFKLGAPVYGVTGIPAIPAVNNIPLYLLELLISAGVAFVLTIFIWKEDKPEEKAAPEPEPALELPTVSVIRCAAGTVMQPVKGNVIAREAIPDDTFASGVLGDGVGIEPEEELVVAPFDGTISSVAESKHAIGIEANGMEMLIHVGVDTVNMQGDGFECLVNEGDEVKLGQPLIRFSREKIKAAGYSDTVAVLLTNSDDLEGVECGAK